jgi:hypothetical protein
MNSINMKRLILLYVATIISTISAQRVQSELPEYEPTVLISMFASSSAEFHFDMDYFYGFLTIPVLFFFILAVPLFLYLIAMECQSICKCCCHKDDCCHCCTIHPSKDTLTETKSDGSKKYKKPIILFGLFYLFNFGIFLSNQMIWIGSSRVDNGVEAVVDSMNDLGGDVFGGINDQAVLMNSVALDGYYYTIGTGNSCVGSLTSAMEDMADAAVSITDLVGDVPTLMKDYSADVESYGYNSKDAMIFLVYVAVVGLSATFIIFEILEIKWGLKFARLISIIVFYGFLVILTIILLMTLFLSSFCMAPIPNIITSIQSSDGGRRLASSTSMIEYYLSRDDNGYICDGVDPLEDIIESARQMQIDAKTTFDALNGVGCTTEFAYITDVLDDYLDGLDVALIKVDCPIINEIFTTFIEDGLCAGLTDGVAAIFMSQFITLICLLCMIVLSFSTVEYFGYAKIHITEENANQPRIGDAYQVKVDYLENNVVELSEFDKKEAHMKEEDDFAKAMDDQIS